MVADVLATLYEAIEGITQAGVRPQETYTSLKKLFSDGEGLSNLSEAVKQAYLIRIDKMETEYQRAEASGSFQAGLEGSKLVTDIAALVTGGARLAKGGIKLTQKVASLPAKVLGKLGYQHNS